jgi:RNA-dependent RNA polymerase
LPFETEMSNRVVRKFIDEEGFSSTSFLRIQIADENGSKIFGFDFTKPIEDRICSVLTSGTVVNGRHYSFLAYSSSQLKESSIWMVSPEGRWNVETMRDSMGDFSSCQSPSKYAARIGQCFSTTYQGLAGNGTFNGIIRHTEVSDVPSAYTNTPHSDGNGLISLEEMKTLLNSMPNVSKKAVANTSVVQIRFGGAKGILVAWDQNVIDSVADRFPWQRSYDVLLRSSMIKFRAPFEYLEICR